MFKVLFGLWLITLIISTPVVTQEYLDYLKKVVKFQLMTL